LDGEEKNKNPREVFAAEYVATLAALPNVGKIISNGVSRLYAIWYRNTVKNNNRCINALAPIWTDLSINEQNNAVKNVLSRVVDGIGHSDQIGELFDIVSALAQYDDPTLFDPAIAMIDGLFEKQNSGLHPRYTRVLKQMLNSNAGAIAVPKWICETIRPSKYETTFPNESKNNGRLWVKYLIKEGSETILECLLGDERLPGLIASMSLWFLSDPLFEVHPYGEDLEDFTSIQIAAGNVSFQDKLDKAYTEDVGKHSFLSLLRTLAPETGIGVWNTIEALYYDDVVKGSLLQNAEVVGMIKESIIAAWTNNPTPQALKLPEL
jgi:hypothetical protein